MREVNREVYTIQSQIAFGEFVKLYLEQHVSTLAPGPRQMYASLLANHMVLTVSKEDLLKKEARTKRARDKKRGKRKPS
jgi:hypothetical protein